MVDQTYLPSKTVTLKDDKLNVASTESSAPKSNIPVNDNYLSHKTVILNAGSIEIKKEEIKPPSLTSAIGSKVDEISQKTINIVNEIKIEKIEEKVIEVKSDIINAINTFPLNIVDVKGNYLSHKTVILNASAIEIKKEEIKPPSLTSAIGSKVDEITQKTINIVNEIKIEKIEEKAIEVQSDIINVINTSPLKTDAVKGNYLSHKTVILNATPDIIKKEDIKPLSVSSAIDTKVDEISQKTMNLVNEIKIEKIEEKAKEVKSDIINAINTSPLKTDAVKGNYLSHKSVNLNTEAVTEKIGEKLKEEVSNKINTPPSFAVSIDSKGNYPVHKTINLSGNSIKPEEKIAEPKISIDVKTIITKEEQTIVQTIAPNTNSSIILEKVSEQKVEFVSKVDITAEKAVKQVIDAPQTIGLKEDKNEIYPLRKTVILKEEVKIPLAVNDKKDLIDQVIVSTENKIESVTVLKTSETPSATYPDHKTHYFVKEEKRVVAENDGAATAATSSSSPSIKKEEPVLQVNNKPGTVVLSAKPKKPVLWMVISSSLFIVTAISVWFFYNQQNSLKEEITLLKINNESLTDSVMKLRRDKLQFDDIIIRGGKIDPKNNITLLENATDAKALRICFSINSNQYATIGKKVVYIRIMDPNNNVLVNTKDNLFEYKGNQIPFSLKKEVEYRKEEMMLCTDYKPEEKLQKGIYKAEIYNDGVLDLEGSFELK